MYGQREEAGRGAAIGDRTHEVHEAYLEHGIAPDPHETWHYKNETKVFYPGKIALSMMPEGIYPAPRTGHVELEFEFERNGVVWNGKIDWHQEPNGRRIKLIDHKTSSNPKKWGLNDETLPQDDQPIIYARALMDRYDMPDAEVVAHWNYGAQDASPRQAYVATARLAPDFVHRRFEEEIEPVGQEIRRLRLMQQVEPMSLQPNASACFTYHKPCPHMEKCKLTTSERLDAIMSGKSKVQDLLNRAKGAQPSAAPAQPPAEVMPDDQVNPLEASQPAQQPTQQPEQHPNVPLVQPATVGRDKKPDPESWSRHREMPKPQAAKKEANGSGESDTDRVRKLLALLQDIDPELYAQVKSELGKKIADAMMNAL